MCIRDSFNTPPVFAIYVVNLITKWLEIEIGGLTQMGELNQQKADLLYAQIDQSQGFYRSAAHISNRSLMNVTFRLETPALESAFIKQSLHHGFSGLEGHRSIAGVRASLYNGVTLQATQELARFMDYFKNTNPIR